MPHSTTEPAPPPAEGAPVPAFIGLGANLGDARATLEAAIARLAALPHSRLQAQSPFYRSAPVDAGGPDYVNAVVRLDTRLAPQALLAELQAIELHHGRERSYRNAPRTLDLDVLLYGDMHIATPALTVPHPRLHQRAFVLLPLRDIAPGLMLPGGDSVEALVAAVADQRIERLALP